MEPLLTVTQVAEYLNVHRNTVKRLGDRGQIPFLRVGTRGDRRIRPADVEAYLTRLSRHPSIDYEAVPAGHARLVRG